MDIDSTNINELPIMKEMNQDGNYEEKMNQNTISSQNIMIDPESVVEHKVAKNVRFNNTIDFDDTPKVNKIDIQRKKIEAQNFDMKIETKIVFLASVIFFIMMDKKVKKYFLNILIQIFGSFLRTEHGTMTQLGLLAYTLLFCLILYTSVKTIDLGAMKFALDM